jgi:alkylation response protein AidB-like acyl-CoA dehydrogenase
MGEICGERVAPRAAEADEEGAQFEDGEVTYTAATLDAIAALRQAELFGAMLPREYGGLNLPESVYSMMVEIVARAESGLMTVYGLQEIASLLEEYGDPETKARVLPRFSRGEVSGAMVLTEAEAGSDLGAVATGRRSTRPPGSGTSTASSASSPTAWRTSPWSWPAVRKAPPTPAASRCSWWRRTRQSRSAASKTRWASIPRRPARSSTTTRRAILLGKRRFGLMRYSMNLMNGARLAVAAQALGIAEAAWREADDYSRERIQFGKPIRVLPAVGRLLLSMRVDLEATRVHSSPKRPAGWTCGRSTRRPSAKARTSIRPSRARLKPARPWPRR